MAKKIKINKEYEKKFNEKRQKNEISHKNSILQQSKYDSETSESEDENAKLLTPELDSKLNKLIKMIRKDHPKLKSIENSYFAHEKRENHNDDKQKISRERTKNQFEKKQSVSQLIAIQLDRDSQAPDQKSASISSQKLKEKSVKKFLKAAKKEFKSDSEESGDFFTEAKNHSKETDFLDGFFESRFWSRNSDAEDIPKFKSLGNESQPDVSDDEDELDRQDEFEKSYNFRFEEPGGTSLKTFSRNQVDSVRNKESRRKAQRKSRRERKERELNVRRKEVERLKKIRDDQIKERLEQIKEIAGVDQIDFTPSDLEEAYDGNKFEQKMSDIFNKAFSNISEVAKNDQENEKRIEEKLKEIESKLNSKNKLDFEDIISGGLKTRFKYVNVRPKNYGLSTEQILNSDDKKLTENISIKFMAPYRNDIEGEKWSQWKHKRNKDDNDNKFARTESFFVTLEILRRENKTKKSKFQT
ncbi:hypothetical protein MHBO_001709 [Bonamia ostreae]|uniref:Kri1-like C-terminal domain-containing protein n=1 Tax=Bonamia ostreae TaxID=126728 RepID=A0ABV2AJV5_9EUKA